MRFDSKNLMESMGLKVGDRFIVDSGDMFEGPWKVIHEAIFKDEILCKSDRAVYQLQDFIDTNVTLIPKYALTEEDKTFIRSISEDETRNRDLTIVREEEKKLLHIGNDSFVCMFLNPKMFKCIKDKEEVPLDELKKCL